MSRLIRVWAKFLPLTLLASLLIGVAVPTTANAGACAVGVTSGTYTISPVHGEVFYIDTGVTPRLDAAFVGYKVQSSVAKSNLWVKLSTFTGGQISLVNINDEIQQIASLSTGVENAETAYFLLKSSGTSTTTDQKHTVTLFEGHPNRGGSSVYTCDFTFTDIRETIKASANKVQSVTVPNSNPALGSLVEVIAVGTMGQPGNGKTPDNDIMWVTPAGFSTWPTSALRLESTSILLDQDGNFDATTNDQATYKDQLLISGIKTLTLGSQKINSSSKYRATYRFRVIGKASSSFKVAPVAQISSGNQYKHSDTNSTATGAFPSLDLTGVTSTMTVTKQIAPKARITNSVLASNVATLTTSEAHGFSLGDNVYISDVGAPYDGAFAVTAVTATTFSYSVTNDPIASASDTGFVFKKNSGTNHALVPYEIKVSSTGTTTVDEIVDVPATGTTFESSSAQIKDVERTSFTSISNPVDDSTESNLDPRPKHFTGPFYTNASTQAVLRYTLRIPSDTSATYSNYAYAVSGTQTVGSTSSAYAKINITSTANGIGSAQETSTLAAPTLNTDSVITLGSTTATIAGTVDPNENSVSIKFQWGTSSNLTSPTEANSSTASSNSADPISVTSDLSSLSANTTYFYRVVVTYSSGGNSITLNGDILNFKTNLIGSTSQTITWGTTFPTYNLANTSSVTQNSVISLTGNDIGDYKSGNVYSNSGLFVDVTSSTPNVCTVTTTATFDNADPPNETSAVYTINFLTSGTCTLVASQPGNATYAAAANVTKNITITSLFTVTFNNNNSTSGSPSSGSVTQTASGGSVTLATQSSLLRSGYTFGGWNTLDTGTGTNSEAGSSYTPTGNITLYAKWTANKYTFNANTGTNPPSDLTYAGVQLTAPSGAAMTAPNGYQFSSWCTTSLATVSSTCSGTTYLANANLPAPSSATVTLYSVWTAASFNLTFNLAGGNISNNTSNVVRSVPYTADGLNVTYRPANPSRAGFTFLGWNTDSNANSALSNYSMPAEDKIIYALWSNAQTYTVTYSSTGNATNMPSDTNQYVSGATVNIGQVEPSRNGFTFTGWKVNGAQSDTVYRTGAANNNTYQISVNVTFDAQWTSNKYVYDKKDGGGSNPSEQIYSGNSLAANSRTSITDPSGYTFGGWCSQNVNRGASCTGTIKQPGEALDPPANETTTLYATWNPIPPETDPADDVTKEVATLKGKTTGPSLGSPKFCFKSSSFSALSDCIDNGGTQTGANGNANGYTLGLAGLQPSTVYHYILFGVVDSLNRAGSVRSFKTLPSVVTNQGTSVSARSATLNARVSEPLTNPSFCYQSTSFATLADCLSSGTTAAAGNPTAGLVISNFVSQARTVRGFVVDSGRAPSQANVATQATYALPVSGLNPNTVYYFIIYGTVGDATYDGGVQNFTTPNESGGGGGGGGGGTSAPVTPPPAINSISQLAVCAISSDITIVGSNMDGAIVKLDGITLVIKSATTNSLVVTLPTGDIGNKILTITTSFGTATANINYATASKPRFQPIRIPYLSQGIEINLDFVADHATRYRLVGRLPSGLVFNNESGVISGTPSENGVYVFDLVAVGPCGETMTVLELDIDAATPNAMSHRINFLPGTCELTDSAKASFENFITRIKGLSPRNIIPDIYISGGSKNSDPNSSLVQCRQNALCDLLLIEDLLGEILTDVFTGAENRIEIIVYWPRPNDDL